MRSDRSLVRWRRNTRNQVSSMFWKNIQWNKVGKLLSGFIERIVLAKHTHTYPGMGVIVDPNAPQLAKEVASRVTWLFFEYVKFDLEDGKADALGKLEVFMRDELARMRQATNIVPR